jgi:hypothetical protein
LTTYTDTEAFDFRILGSPAELEAAITPKAREDHSARMTAAFCSPWSNPKRNGTLVEDARIGEYARPWNAKSGVAGLRRAFPRRTVGLSAAHRRAGIPRSAASWSPHGRRCISEVRRVPRRW